jgi:two-component system CheB/CheR fusion protein
MVNRKPKPTSPKTRRTKKNAAGRKPSRAANPRANSEPPARPLPIVGMGASAGGFEALHEFFKSIPPDPGAAFIVVQHLDPTRVSEMPALLARWTQLKVLQAEDGATLEPNVVYTIPPGRYLIVQRGKIRLTHPAEPRGLRLPIDVLFYSMAEETAECAIGIILSGSGADGSLGLRAIKGHGGLGMVQDPATAEYDSMPRNAIATGVVDYILPPRKMMTAIAAFIDHDYVKKPADNNNNSKVPEYVHNTLALLHARRNVDFSGYKKGTLIRRIDRRMSVRHISRGADYLALLREDPDEVNALFNDMLIQVTRFFREPETWKVLEREVLARLVETADKDNPIRVWVAGCASGEEAYSVAILLLELAEKSQKPVPIQIFASDLDRASLDQARAGSYPESIAADVSSERLNRFFIHSEHRYVASQLLRDTVIFAHQNLLVDPPFSRLDLICCRNVLIYLESLMQRRVFDLFHFALKPGRYLFLGNSETVGSQTDLFQSMSKRARVYRRLGTVRYDRVRLSMAGMMAASTMPVPSITPPTSRESLVLAQAREYVLERHTTASALINRRMEILSLFGRTGDYLSQPSGPLTADILSWVREGVRSKLRMAVQTAIRKNGKVTIGGIKARRGDTQVPISITVELLSSAAEADGLLLVAFRDEAPETLPRERAKNEPEEPLVQQLEYELKVARDELQTSVEQLESSNEELRATNEEVLSMNEELQSANEELETSKEELQSVNEELSAVNSQLEGKIQEVQGVSEDISNLLSSTDLPTLFLDRKFQIRRYTAGVTRLFRIIPADLGRPVEDIVRMVRDDSLIADGRVVLERLQPVEREIQIPGDGGYLRRVLPYRTADDRIDGVVVTYTDISDRIRADRLVRETRDFAEAIVETLREPLLVLDQHQAILSANAAFYRVFHLNPKQVIGRRIHEAGNREWNIPELRRMLENMLPEQTQIHNMEIQREFAGIGERVVCVNARTLEMAGQKVILVALEDITHRIEAERTRTQILRQVIGAEEKERHRLALELHDETGQHVTAFLLGLANLKETYARQPESRALIENLQGRAEELARHLHGISLQLRPTALDDHGLERALSNYVEDITLRNDLEIDLHAAKNAARLPSHIETVLYRVTQEALTNVLKHSRATKVSVVLARKKKEISLIVEDNGSGFRAENALEDGDKAHLGLRGMRERVMLAGGTLTVESAPGSGTSLFARIPLQSDSDGDPEE